MSHAMKLWEGIVIKGLRKVWSISVNQFGSMPEVNNKSPFSYYGKQAMEQFWANKKNLYMVFIDLEKTYDRVRRNIIWRTLKVKRVPNLYIDLIKDMYEGADTCVKMITRKTEEFAIQVVCIKYLLLNPYLPLWWMIWHRVYMMMPHGICFL